MEVAGALAGGHDLGELITPEGAPGP
jgi:hypothetical protein